MSLVAFDFGLCQHLFTLIKGHFAPCLLYDLCSIRTCH
jgi:hypothetical protein